MTERVVIVGGGQAAASAAFRLRSQGFAGSIDILSEESEFPYQRPPLSKKYLKGMMERDRLLLRPEALYRENDITVHLNTQALHINRSTKRIATDGNANMPYDKLVIATGATPRRLPKEIGGHLSNVMTFRTLADADLLAEYIRPGQRLLIVGGGYIGLEMAAVGIDLGLEVTLVEVAPRILNRVACAQTADWFRRLHLDRGVDLREGVGLSQLIAQDDKAALAALSDGSAVGVDFVVAGIGVTANDKLARSAGLSVQNGIATDDQCRAFDPDIFAIGDCAVFPYRGEMTRLESVQNACDQGDFVADHILGKAPAAYVPEPWFWSDQYDVSLKIAGLNRGYDTIHVRPGERNEAVSHWYFRGPNFLAVDAIDDPKAYMIGKKWLAAGGTPVVCDLIDPSIPLKSVRVGTSS
ncbi:MAG: pyridine nucleotide-disulfide oxidoreductase [Ahrensia sp.]|nr:pyridine nucleotide-disulfide oxidoreductase [Ahrensia sp.]